MLQPNRKVPGNSFFKPAQLLSFVWSQRRFLSVFMFWRAVSVLVIAPILIMVQVIVDECLPAKSLSCVLYYTGISVILLLAHIVSMKLAIAHLAPKMQLLMRRMRAQIFHRLQFMHFGFLDQTQTGKLLSKYAYDTNNVEMTVIQLVLMLIPEIVRGVTLLLVLILVDPWLSVFSLIALMLFITFRLVYMKPLREVNHKVRVTRELLTGRASEFISAIKLVRSFGQESDVRGELNSLSRDYGIKRQEEMVLNTTMGYVIFSMMTAIHIFAVAFGAILVVWGHLTVGALMALVGALPVILMPVNFFMQFTTQYYLGREAYMSIRELMQKGYVENWQGKHVFKSLKGRISYEKVSLQYEKGSHAALQDVDLEIAEGEHVAFVGPSGAGKSSMVNLLLGLYVPRSGEIRIDDVNLASLDMHAFRRQCAIVMQENLLLSGTIYENISFGKPEASEGEILWAAEEANAKEFIERLPDGYQSRVGERGVSLSGGQRQRIAIARALLRDPRILILDEATSALDYENEKMVRDAIDRLSQNRTTITIAHRLSTIRNANRVVVLDKGKITETGSYEAMCQRTGSYLHQAK